MENKKEYSGCTISSNDYRCFECLSPEEKQLIDDNSVIIQYKKGENISKQGGFVSQILFMEQGLAKVYIENGSNSLLLRITPGGSFIGLSALSHDYSTYPYSAKVYIDSTIRHIDISIFRQIINQNSRFAMEIINILGTNSVQIYGRFFCLTHKQAYGRLADIILCLAFRIYEKNTFDLPLSRKDLAELSGMSSETVVRMLKKFNEDGLIKMEGRKLEVINIERLQHISDTG